MFQLRNIEKKLTITAYGKFAKVTQNMYAYEYRGEILIVDCGMGFTQTSDGQEGLLIPDITYLKTNRGRIKGIVLTHGHEDHIGGLGYILPQLGVNIPVYGSKLTLSLAKDKLEEAKIYAVRLNEINSESVINLGQFIVNFVHVTHSIPDTFNVVIQTPVGIIYHAADYKFDWTPVMDRPTEVGKIAMIGQKGVLLLLSDCLRSEKPGYTLSEQMIEDSLEREIKSCKGKFFVTTMSSNVSRWQQAINVAISRGRRIVPMGRSVEKIIKIAMDLKYLNLPAKMVIPVEKAKNFPDRELAFLISGSQGQSGSALEKLAKGKSRYIKIGPKDRVVFSADYIPGNEVAINTLIDKLSRLGAEVSYSGILDDLHVSGHGAQLDQTLMISLVKAKYLLPIGGEFRMMKQFSQIAQNIGYPPERILLPEENQIIEVLGNGQVRLGQKIQLQLSVIKQNG